MYVQIKNQLIALVKRSFDIGDGFRSSFLCIVVPTSRTLGIQTRNRGNKPDSGARVEAIVLISKTGQNVYTLHPPCRSMGLRRMLHQG